MRETSGLAFADSCAGRTGLQSDTFGIVPSSKKFDFPDTPLLEKTLEQCKAACTSDPKCVAFSWRVDLAAGAKSDCWLKGGGLNSAVYIGPTKDAYGETAIYTTYIVNDGLCREHSDGSVIRAGAAHAMCCADVNPIFAPAAECASESKEQRCCAQCRRHRGKRAKRCCD